MKILGTFLGVLITGAAFCFSATRPPPLAAQTTIPTEFDGPRKSLRAVVDRNVAPSVAAAVARGERIIWNEAFGWADRERRREATTETPFSIASMTKPITATAIMLLSDRGKLSLDDPVTRHAPLTERPGVSRPDDVTIRRTLGHIAGFPVHYQYFYEDQKARPASFKQTMRCFGAEVGTPGFRFSYSNLGFDALRAAVEHASGESFRNFLAREIFLPLGMRHSSVVEEPEQAPDAAVRYGSDGKPLPFYWTDHPGASAVYATAADLVRFGQFHAGAAPGVLKRESVADMQRAGLGNYGLGWSVNPDWHGRLVVYHSGAMPGASATLWVVPAERISIAVMANQIGAPVNRIAGEILEQLLATTGAAATGRVNDEAPGSRPPAPAGDARGDWQGTWSTCPDAEPISIDARDNGNVVVRIANGDARTLESAVVSNGRVTGTLQASPGLVYRLDLRVEAGRLRGSVVKRSSLGPRGNTSVTLWAELSPRRSRPR
jgi:CubicO group peptidase (beta-lactamase class C family)